MEAIAEDLPLEERTARPEPEPANDNDPAIAARLERLQKEHDGQIFDGVIYGAEVQGQKGQMSISADGVAVLHTHCGAWTLVEAKPIYASPFTLGNPSSLPEREWLFGRHYIRRYLTATVGAGGGGKSAHAVSEVLAMVTGRPTSGS